MAGELVFGPATKSSLVQPVLPVYLLFGEDDRQKDEAIALIRDRTVEPDFSDFDFEVLDATAIPADEVLAAASLVPFGSSMRMVVVRGAEVYRKRDRSADAERIAEGIASLGSQTCLVLCAAAAEDESGRGKTALHPKIDAAVRARGLLVRCRALGSEDLRDLVTNQARSQGRRLEPEAAERLVQASHGDRRMLENELEKALCYAGDRTSVTPEDVDAVCSYDAEDVMFKLVDAVSQRNTDRALYLLNEILRFDSKPQSVAGRLIALLVRQFRLLWQARELMACRVDAAGLKQLPAELAAELPSDGSIMAMTWKAGELFRTAKTWDRAAIAGTFDQLLRVDLSNKGGEEGSEDVVTNLKLLILDLCRRK